MANHVVLNYWSGRGLMEVTRVLLALAGKFPPADYDDARWAEEGVIPADGKLVNPRPYSEVGKHVKLGANVGRLPVAEVNGVPIGQSLAIWYYFAAEHGFLGNNHLEAAQIIAVVETLKEARTDFSKLFPFGEPIKEENVEKWFEQGATDAEGPADMSKRSQRFLTWWTARLENQLSGEAGFAVGNKLSLADVVIHNAYAETLEAHQTVEKTLKAYAEPWTSKERTHKLLAKHHRIQAICDNVAAQPNFQKWLKERGVQYF